MNTIVKSTLGLAALLAAGVASADITFYQNDNFSGRQFTTRAPVDNFNNFGFNDRASSAVVTGGPEEVCEDAGFRGHCIVLRPGNYPSLSTMGLNDRISSAREADHNTRWTNDQYAPMPLPGQITFYENDNFQGRTFNATSDVPNFSRFGFNDRASSVIVVGDRWEACDNAGFAGKCIVLRPGRYPSLGAMGLNDRISSVRLLQPGVTVEESRYAPIAQPAYDYRQRPQEPVYQANVVSAHAVYANGTQHCWVEQEQVSGGSRQNQRIAGAAIGGLLGGILGHQIGGGNASTVGGALGGAALGTVIGNNVNNSKTQDVQKCAPSQAQGNPQYWDTVYSYRGTEHHVQSTTEPGATINVNANGEPRL